MNKPLLECVVLAAGQGSRLAPLTDAIPKPLLPFGEGTIMSRLVDQLGRLGPRRVLCNAHHRADAVERYASGNGLPVPLVVRREQQLRGPAGSLHTFRDEIRAARCAIVVSGDVHLAGSLEHFLERHVASTAAITVMLVQVPDGSKFGVFDFDAAGVLSRVAEKPSWATGRRSWVSAGIYCVQPEVLEMIPDDEPYDFAAHLVPAMLAAGRPVNVVPWFGRWRDLGTVGEYRGAVLDDVRAQPCGTTRDGGGLFVGAGAEIHDDAALFGDVYVASEALIEAGATLRDCVVLSHAHVHSGQVVVEGVVA